MNRLKARETVRGLLNDIENSDVAHNWPDALINEFIQEAINEIAQRTLCNKDSISSEYCVIPVMANVVHYAYPDGVLSVDSVRRSWDGRELTHTSTRDLKSTNPLWESSTVAPSKFLTDFSTGYISIVGRLTSVTNEELRLTVYRMPAELSSDADDLDIPLRFHNYILNWVMYRCLQKLGGTESTANSKDKLYGVEMSQRFLVSFEGNPSQNGYGGDIGKILRMLNRFDTPRYSQQF